MDSSYCLNMSLCNNHENNETNISFYNILLNAWVQFPVGAGSTKGLGIVKTIGGF